MSIIPKDFSYLEHDEYSEFDEKIYTVIRRTNLDYFGKYLKSIYGNYNLNYECFLLNNFQYSFSIQKLELLCTTKYEKNSLATFIIQDNGFFIDFIDYTDLLNNLDKFTGRYYPLLCYISIPGFGEYHCAVFIIDKNKKNVYLVDSNGDVVNYYAKYFEDPEIINIHFNETIKKLFEPINYEYIPAFYNNITKSINKKNEEINCKNFFSGYCVAWSLFFSELFLSEKNKNDDIKKIINTIYSLTDLQQNEIINRYHCYLYLNFCIQIYSNMQLNKLQK